MVCTPQNNPSIATMFGLTSSVPHVSTSAPVSGTMMPELTVTGLTTGYVLGGAASGSGVFDVQASDANFFLNSSTLAELRSVATCVSHVTACCGLSPIEEKFIW